MKDGGPAFPTFGNNTIYTAPGMSLRDYFAAAALAGLMSDMGLRPSTEEEFSTAAKRLYQFADAMLAEREKQPNPGSSGR